MNVTFKHCGERLASSRYRALIPTRELAKLGIGQGKEWVVMNKHNWDWEEQTAGFEKKCYDVCDSHWDDKWGDHYRTCISKADLVTCNSEAMRTEIETMTRRKATVIPDPWEQPERKPRVSDKLLWFGHLANLPDLAAWMPLLRKYELQIVSNLETSDITHWTPESMDAAFDAAGLVIIPTGKSAAKSGNRAIESLRRGLFPICGPLPAYSDLGVWVGDIYEGVRWALSHQDEVIRRIKTAQAYIREEYSPARIGLLWKQALWG